MLFNARICTVILTATLASAAPSPVLAAGADGYSGRVMYRYTKDDGTTVMHFSLDTEAAKKGYTILTPSGRVIAEVPPELTDEERAQLEIEREQKKRDRYLLDRYSSVEEVEAARDREVGDLQSRVKALQGNMMSVKTNMEQQQARAADQERRGFTPNERQLKAIDDLAKKIDTIQDDIEIKQAEVDAVRAQYEKDIERFHYIEEKYKAVLERRRARMSRPG